MPNMGLDITTLRLRAVCSTNGNSQTPQILRFLNEIVSPGEQIPFHIQLFFFLSPELAQYLALK